MTEQPDLFDIGERVKNDPPRIACTPDKIGTGPNGETCGSCRWIHRSPSGRYRKCRLTDHRWTHGTATDIKAAWPACSKWQDPEETFREHAESQLQAAAKALDLPKELLDGEKHGGNLTPPPHARGP
jgi:hypothetical protein